MRKLQYVTSESPILRIFTAKPGCTTLNPLSIPTDIEESSLQALVDEIDNEENYLRDLGITPPIARTFKIYKISICCNEARIAKLENRLVDDTKALVAIVALFNNKAKAIYCNNRRQALRFLTMVNKPSLC